MSTFHKTSHRIHRSHNMQALQKVPLHDLNVLFEESRKLQQAALDFENKLCALCPKFRTAPPPNTEIPLLELILLIKSEIRDKILDIRSQSTFWDEPEVV